MNFKQKIKGLPTYKTKDTFMRSINKLYHKGGLFQKASQKCQSIICRIGEPEIGIDPLEGFKITNHGETRIDKCIKYDLGHGCRLITIQDQKVILFLYAGTHDDCDKWLNKNRGIDMMQNEKKEIGLFTRSKSLDNDETIFRADVAFPKGKLLEMIKPESYVDRLLAGIPPTAIGSLMNLESTNSEEDIFNCVSGFENNDQAIAIHDVLILLRQDKREEALDRTKVFLGEASAISILRTDEEILALADSKNIKTIPSDDPDYQKIFEHFLKSTTYMEWMLYLHPDQETIVEDDYKGPVRLAGVSGSGKTCIIVQRAIRLAKKYPGQKILVLTLNRQLANLIKDMVDAACPETIRRQYIEVMPFFKLCQKLLHEFEPQNDKLYDDTTWKSKEHVDEIWREFYRCQLNVDDAEILSPLHDSLLARGVNPEEYIREEFDWLRSSVKPIDRKEYINIKRAGRGYPLTEKFRALVIEGLSLWEKKMQEVGVTDYLGLSSALYPYREIINQNYRCVLIDEAQDFGTIELELIRQLVDEKENDIFCCGDIAQRISTKHHSFTDANINIPRERSLKVIKNYRNSKEILEAAYNILNKNFTEELLYSPDFEILDPEFANFSAAVPLILKANDLEEEIAFSLEYILRYLENEPGKKGCLGLCGYSLYEVQQFGKELNINVLDGEVSIGNENTYLSDLEHMKGFEFDVVVIANCNEGVIPNKFAPENEHYRDLSRLYVAMTRAKDQLILSCSYDPSKYLLGSKDYFLDEKWSNYLEDGNRKTLGIPPTLDQITENDQERKNWLSMTGPEFLYTHDAIGLNSSLIDKLRSLVTGKSIRRNGVSVGWKDIKSLQVSMDIDPRTRRLLGVEALSAFQELLEEMEKHF